MMGSGNRMQVKGGEIQDPRRIDIEHLYNMGKMDLEKQCIYLMKKRIALEDAIAILEGLNKGLHNTVINREKMLEQRAIQISSHQTITNRTLERLNKEKDTYIQEIQRLQAENKVLRERVSGN